MARRFTDSEARKIMIEAGLKPLVPFTSSSTPWNSKCIKCRREVKPTLNNVYSKGARCTFCSGNKVHLEDALKIMKKAKLQPLDDFPGAKKAWKAKCLVCDQEVAPTFSSVKRGGGCKFCARKKVGLSIKTPDSEAIEIMKSAGLKPLEPFKSSGTPWKCRCMKCKREVTPRLSMVKSKNSGCAFCSGRRVDGAEAEKLFKKKGLSPLIPYPGNKTPWRSIHRKCGKEVSPTYQAIADKGQGPCKFCAGVSVDPKDAEALFLSKNLKPLEPYSGDSKKPWRSIHIPCGKEVSPNYNIIQQEESMGCKFCSDQFVDPDEAFQFMVAKGFQPKAPYPGSNKGWDSIHLICGSEVRPSFGKIKSGRVGCPVCSGNLRITQERAFEFFRTKGLEPQEAFQGPHHPWKSIHTECGKLVSPRWASVQQGNSGCAYCSGNKVDMKDAKALLKKLGLKPLEAYPGSSVPWKCIHLKCGTEVSPAYAALRSGQGPCAVCGKNMVTKKEALELLAKNNYKPLEDFPGGSKPWSCVHEACGTTVNVTATYLRSGGKGCSFCAGTKPITAAQAVKQFKFRGYKPLEPFVNARSPISAVHTVCGNKVLVSWSLIRSGGNCRYCMGWRNLLAPAYVYLITSKDMNSHKIGVSSVDASDNRVERHLKNGWTTYAQIELETGDDAYDLESKVLDWLRSDLQLPAYLVPELMPQGGYTETVDASEIDLPTIWAKVEELSKVRKF